MTKSRTQKVREAREKQRRRNQQRNIAIGVAVVAVVILLLLIVSNTPSEASIPEGVAERYEGIQTGETEEGYAILGDPDAPVSVAEYSSFSCPHCREFHDTTFDLLVDRVREGQISVTYIPLNVAGNNVEGANKAAICALNQDMFWEYHDTLFSWQGLYGASAFTQNRLVAGADALGLDMSAFNSCVASGATQSVLDNAVAAAASDGITSTPTILINGSQLPTDQLTTQGVANAIDAAYAPFAGQETTPDEVEVTEEATEEMEVTEEATEEVAEPTEAMTEEATDEADMTEEATEEPAEEVTEEATEEATVEATSES